MSSAAPAPTDPFSPDALRLRQDFGESAGVEKLVTVVQVRKPDKQWFNRVHPDEAYRMAALTLEFGEDRLTYLVVPALGAELSMEAKPCILFTAVNRQGIPFLWPCRMPRADGRPDQWGQSALDAVNLAMKDWVRVSANMSLGAYEVARPIGVLPEPVWPRLSFHELLKIAFRDRLIDSVDHPVIRRLRGAS